MKQEIQETNKTDLFIARMQKWLFRVFIALVILAVLFVGITFVNIMPVDTKDDKIIEFVIDKGMGKREIVYNLKDKDLIKNELFAKIYVGIIDTRTIYPGTYKLSKSMGLQDIIEILATGDSIENEEINITFIEGKSFPYYVTKISENFQYNEDEIYNIINDREYLKKLINEYWFIEDDILDEKLYYPLEGYIFPDTYLFKKTATIEEIFKTLLDKMGNVLESKKDLIQKSDYKIHGLLTLASVVELEAINDEDRAIVAGLFYNRLSKSIPLGSDVTTYYGIKKDLTSKLENVDIDSCNAYNTRGTCAVNGLPKGPICAVSESSIKAVLNPKENDYYYFVADKNSKLYFANTYEEHKKIINDLKNKGLWAA